MLDCKVLSYNKWKTFLRLSNIVHFDINEYFSCGLARLQRHVGCGARLHDGNRDSAGSRHG